MLCIVTVAMDQHLEADIIMTLYVTNVPNSNNCYTYLNNAYKCPSGQKADMFLTRSETFRVSEMEVYRL